MDMGEGTAITRNQNFWFQHTGFTNADGNCGLLFLWGLSYYTHTVTDERPYTTDDIQYIKLLLTK